MGHVSKYTIPMDPMGLFKVFFFHLVVVPCNFFSMKKTPFGRLVLVHFFQASFQTNPSQRYHYWNMHQMYGVFTYMCL